MIRFERRRLGALEKVFWLLDQTSQVHFVMAAEIDSRFPISAWRTALNAVQQRHPLFSAGIESNGYLYPVFVQDPASTQIPLRVLEAANTCRWEAEMETALADPFDWSKAPLVRAVLIQQQQKSVFILAAHHAVADGISMSFVIRDTLAALAGKILSQLTVPKPIDALLMMNDTGAVQNKNNGEADFIIKRKTEQRPQIKKFLLSSAMTTRVAARAKEEGTTVHGALSAALLIAARKIRQDWKDMPVRMVHPVAIRAALNVQEDAGLYITSKVITYEPGSNDDFWALARYTKLELKNSNSLQTIRDRTSELQKKVFKGISAGELSAGLQKTAAREMMLTNLGRVPYSTDFGSFRLQGIWGPLALSGYPGDQTIGVSTTDGVMHLMHVSRVPIAGLLSATIDELMTACQ